MGFSFDWDTDKSAQNERKHGITFEEATTVFYQPNAKIKYDPQHSIDEDRYIIFGFSEKGRLLLVVFTDRDSIIRIISSRLPQKYERDQYFA